MASKLIAAAFLVGSLAFGAFAFGFFFQAGQQFGGYAAISAIQSHQQRAAAKLAAADPANCHQHGDQTYCLQPGGLGEQPAK